MFWNMLWSFIKNNILAIVLVITALVIAGPWALIFVAPIVILFLIVLGIVWRIRRAQQQMFEEARRQAEGQHREQQSQRQWWRKKNSNEGEVTVVQTSDSAEPRVSDDVGEYVDFKEIKEDAKSK